MATLTAAAPVRAPQAGFTYLWLLFAIAVAGAAAAAIGERASVARQREKEAELAFRGQAIARAIASYWAATPAATKELPSALAELVEDRRGPAIVRHLRRVYDDPFTGRPDWVLITADDGRVRGVRSGAEVVAFSVVGLASAPSGTSRRVSERLFVFAPAPAEPASQAASPPRRPVRPATGA